MFPASHNSISERFAQPPSIPPKANGYPAMRHVSTHHTRNRHPRHAHTCTCTAAEAYSIKTRPQNIWQPAFSPASLSISSSKSPHFALDDRAIPPPALPCGTHNRIQITFPFSSINTQSLHSSCILTGSISWPFLCLAGRIIILSSVPFSLAPQKLNVLLAQILCLQ